MKAFKEAFKEDLNTRKKAFPWEHTLENSISSDTEIFII